MVKHQNAEKAADISDDRNDSRFKGVRKRKWGKYVSEIRLPNSRERIWLGSYDTAVKAARAFDAALFCLRGRSAQFNFPDNPPDIAGGRSLSPAEIQSAAARFANEGAPDSGPSRVARPESLSPSPSVVSDGSHTAPLDCELANDASFMELFNNLGTGHGYDAGYGMFPEFDDLGTDFFPPAFPVANDYVVEDNYAESSYLWNF